MALDWEAIFDRVGVHYVTTGPNVAKGHLNIRCPWCGNLDPSQHLSVSLDGRGYRCYRNHEHRGKSAARLLSAAAGVSVETAQALVGGQTYMPTDPMSMVLQSMGSTPRAEKPELKMPKEFRPFRNVASAWPYLTYLVDRGFSRSMALKFTDWFDLRYCTEGPYRGRIIFPVEYRGKLVSWVGRTISKTTELRYKALSVDPDEGPAAIGPLPDYLLWFDDLKVTKADKLILCEGPFDALKLTVIGYEYGVVATCFFTSAPSGSQIELLYELAPRFKHRFLMLDRGTLPTALRFTGQHPALGLRPLEPPPGVKDPGEMTERALLETLPLRLSETSHKRDLDERD
jgi:hypothetical protein